jgi:hypothetical protein
MKTLSLLCLVLLTGCQTPYQFPAPGPAWETHVGQLQSTGNGHSVIGDVVVSRSAPSEFQLDFLSGPGFPILKMRISGDHGRAESSFARASWQGNPRQAPGPLRAWLALPEVFTAAEASTGAPLASNPPRHWTAQAEKSQGRLTQLRVDFLATGESFRFQFRR